MGCALPYCMHGAAELLQRKHRMLHGHADNTGRPVNARDAALDAARHSNVWEFLQLQAIAISIYYVHYA